MRVQDGSFRLDRVIEKLATSDKVTLTIERLPKAKCESHQTVGSTRGCSPRGQVLEVRWVNGSLHVARKERHHDEWDPPIEPSYPYGPRRNGRGVTITA